MRILFMGTPEIAVPTLRALVTKHEVIGVFCRPDKPVGRKQILTAPPVKNAALELGLPVFQPKTLRCAESLQLVRDLCPDAVALIAYGRILPPEILSVPKFGCINAHASLLPKYRGSAPIQRALMNGETLTGITAMKMDEGLDTGDILASVELSIGSADNEISMFKRLGDAAAELMVKVFDDLEEYLKNATPQDSGIATFAPPLKKEEGLFDFEKNAVEIVNLVRGICNWPVAFFEARGKTVKVFQAVLRDEVGNLPGTVLSVKPLVVAARDGAVELCEVMPQNSKRMTGQAYAAGLRLKPGDVL